LNVPAAPPPPAVTDPTTEKLAIASLVSGLVWAGGLASVAALVTGVMALRRGPTGTYRPMAIVGVVLGALGTLSLVAIVAGVLHIQSVTADERAARAEQELTTGLLDAADTLETHRELQGAYPRRQDVALEAAVPAYVPWPEVTVTLVRSDERAYCLHGVHTTGAQGWYDSTVGGVAATPC
jgi:hypothetical protein